MTGPAKRAEARVLRRKQPHKEENTRPSRKLVQGRSIWRSVSRSTRSSQGAESGNAIRRPCSARTEEREISRTVRGDVSTLRLHRSSFSGITRSATKGHTLFLNMPWTEHDCREACFRCNNTILSRNTLRKSAIQRLHLQNDGARSPSAKRRPAPRIQARAGKPAHAVSIRCASREPLVCEGRYSLCLSQPTASLQNPDFARSLPGDFSKRQSSTGSMRRPSPLFASWPPCWSAKFLTKCGMDGR